MLLDLKENVNLKGKVDKEDVLVYILTKNSHTNISQYVKQASFVSTIHGSHNMDLRPLWTFSVEK